MPAVVVINRRIVQHKYFPHEDGPVIHLDVELARNNPFNKIASRLDNEEQRVSLIEGRVIFLDFQQPEPDTANLSAC